MIRHAATGGGVQTAYAVAGAGLPLVLLHGAEADHSMFDALVPLLAAHCTVIAPDQRDSGATRNPPEPYGIDDLADDVAGLIEALGHGRAHVFGTSLGSVIAQALALRHPARVDRLVLSSAIRIGRTLGGIAPETARALAALRAAGDAEAMARFFYPADWLAAHPEAIARFRGGSRTPAQQARRGALLPGAAERPLAGIGAPTLLLVGGADALVPPAHSLGIATEIAGATTRVLQSIGHIGAIQAPEAVAGAVLEFLEIR